MTETTTQTPTPKTTEPLKRRVLTFDTFDDAIAEAERLLETGYVPAGNWTLGQNCRHLADFMRYSLDGFPGWFRMPWPLTALIRATVLTDKKLDRPMPGGMPTAPFLKQIDPADDAEQVAEFAKQARRVRDHEGAFQSSPIAGKVEARKWKMLHRRHAELHLGMLVPAEA